MTDELQHSLIGSSVALTEHIECKGIVVGVDGGWLRIEWDVNCSGPALCHRSELTVMPIDGSAKRTYGNSRR